MNSDKYVYDSNPIPPIDEAEVIAAAEVIAPDKSNAAVILVCLSLLSYIAACMLPLKFEDVSNAGIWAIFLGIFVPMAWIPNPLYVIGWVLALARSYALAIAFALVACIWSLAVVFSGDFEGPAQFFWVLSKAILLFACLKGILHSKS